MLARDPPLNMTSTTTPEPGRPERREFVRVALMLGLGVLAAGAGAYNLAVRLPTPPKPGPLPLMPLDQAGQGAFKALSKVGAWLAVEVTLARRDGHRLVTRAQTIYLRRVKEGDGEDCFAALSPVCPHAGCGVDLIRGKDEPDRFRCACHNASFSSDGEVTGGPSPRGMDPLKLSIGAHEGGRWLMVEWRDYLPGSAERTERA